MSKLGRGPVSNDVRRRLAEGYISVQEAEELRGLIERNDELERANQAMERQVEFLSREAQMLKQELQRTREDLQNLRSSLSQARETETFTWTDIRTSDSSEPSRFRDIFPAVSVDAQGKSYVFDGADPEVGKIEVTGLDEVHRLFSMSEEEVRESIDKAMREMAEREKRRAG